MTAPLPEAAVLRTGERSERPSAPGLGATCVAGGVFFRVWAPGRRKVDVVLEAQANFIHPLKRAADGYFEGFVAAARPGSLYRYRLDGGATYPDPCSRFQPDGPHGPSCVVDAGRFRWSDGAWPGIRLPGQVFYELHVGTFTPEGSYRAVIPHLDRLKKIGVTTLELMAVSDCPGRWNWGYDGVCLFAPSHLYGTPDDLRALVDAAHARRMGVLLDVVYNHLGPDGNYLAAYNPRYFTRRYKTEWGDPLNFDGPGSAGVRRFFVENAAYWIRDFHFDGFRLDATQNVYDSGSPHILAEVTAAARAAAGTRSILMIGENEPQDVRCLEPIDRNGFGLDGLWNDDFHHSARVALTGFREAYYTDYRGEPQEIISSVKRGFLFQGQFYAWQGKKRGTVIGDQPACAMITFLDNHDQVANEQKGRRLHTITRPESYRAMVGVWLLSPGTPLLFMGQEDGAPNPFPFFADHKDGLREKVKQGRLDFLRQFPSYAKKTEIRAVPDPGAASTHRSAVLDHRARAARPEAVRLYADLLALRRADGAIRAQDRSRWDGAVLSPKSFALRFDGDGDDRLIVCNLNGASPGGPSPEPLLAPPSGRRWRLVWSSNDRRYGGRGASPIDPESGSALLGPETLLFKAIPISAQRKST